MNPGPADDDPLAAGFVSAACNTHPSKHPRSSREPGFLLRRPTQNGLKTASKRRIFAPRPPVPSPRLSQSGRQRSARHDSAAAVERIRSFHRNLGGIRGRNNLRPTIRTSAHPVSLRVLPTGDEALPPFHHAQTGPAGPPFAKDFRPHQIERPFLQALAIEGSPALCNHKLID
jgi:hypothetical protein